MDIIAYAAPTILSQVVENSAGAIIQSKYRVCWGPHQTHTMQTLGLRPYISETLHVKLDRQRTDRTVANTRALNEPLLTRRREESEVEPWRMRLTRDEHNRITAHIKSPLYENDGGWLRERKEHDILGRASLPCKIQGPCCRSNVAATSLWAQWGFRDH